MKKPPRIAISLGASFMGYATHAGFMARLHSWGVRPTAIAGSSAGAITAGLYAAGLGQEAIRDAVLSPRLYLSFATGTRWVWHQFVRAHQDAHPGFLDPRGAIRHFESFVGQRDIASFTHPKLMIALSDLKNAETLFASRGPLATAMAASACVPMMFSPIEFDGRQCTDGGVAHETPVDPWFTDDEVDHIIIHRIDQPPGRPPFFLHGRLIATMFASREAMGRQILADRLRLAEVHGKKVTLVTTEHARPSPLWPRGLKDRYAIGEATAQKLYDEHLAQLG